MLRWEQSCLAEEQEELEGDRLEARRLRCESSGDRRGSKNKEEEMRGEDPKTVQTSQPPAEQGGEGKRLWYHEFRNPLVTG